MVWELSCLGLNENWAPTGSLTLESEGGGLFVCYHSTRAMFLNSAKRAPVDLVQGVIWTSSLFPASRRILCGTLCFDISRRLVANDLMETVATGILWRHAHVTWYGCILLKKYSSVDYSYHFQRKYPAISDYGFVRGYRDWISDTKIRIAFV